MLPICIGNFISVILMENSLYFEKYDFDAEILFSYSSKILIDKAFSFLGYWFVLPGTAFLPIFMVMVYLALPSDRR